MPKKNKKVTIDGLARMVQKGFNGVDKQFEIVNKQFKAIVEKFESVDERFDIMDERFDRIEKLLITNHNERIERLEMQVQELRGLLAMK